MNSSLVCAGRKKQIKKLEVNVWATNRIGHIPQQDGIKGRILGPILVVSSSNNNSFVKRWASKL